MDLEWLLRLVFVLYCMTVGVVLCLIPWTPGWDFMTSGLPFPRLLVLQQPLLRGSVSGFGLVHLVWGAHDLSELLRPGFRTHADRD